MVEPEALSAISALSIKGFKSFWREQGFEVRPLTLLAGSNSSGKSSAIQPLLLLKQTLEAAYDPGSLLLDGPHVKFTAAQEILANIDGEEAAREFVIGVTSNAGFCLENTFQQSGFGLEVVRTSVSGGRTRIDLEPEMSHSALTKLFKHPELVLHREGSLGVERDRCFLQLVESIPIREGAGILFTVREPHHDRFTASVSRLLQGIVHVPGLRGNPERNYRATAVGENFPGTFDNYCASIISHWQQQDDERFEALNSDLERVGLTARVRTRQVNAAQVELLVGRLPKLSYAGDVQDLVNIADVGIGVSQALPVIVALQAARYGQLVYIEQPELHLHPRAQQVMAEILANAARRGVRVVAETHSSILLLAVQSLVAEGKLDPALVKLHWFQRDERGATQVHSTDLDENGAYGDWPEDFGEVQAQADNRYLDAIEARAFGPRPAAKRAKVKKK